MEEKREGIAKVRPPHVSNPHQSERPDLEHVPLHPYAPLQWSGLAAGKSYAKPMLIPDREEKDPVVID